MSEIIEAITELEDFTKYSEEEYNRWCGREAGFSVRTSEQNILLLIDDVSSCCEQWGYFLSEDNFDKFIGARLLDISLTDTNLTSRTFYSWDWKTNDYNKRDKEGNIDLASGDTMFVNLKTDRGVLQFVAYNSHNGYYGHTARIVSRQLEHSEVL